MNHLLYAVCLAGFLATPPLLVGVRFFKKAWMPWWFLFLLVAVLAWIFVNGGVWFYYRHLNDLIARHPSALLLAAATADGAKRVFALLLGWLCGLVWLLPWLVVYAVARRAPAARAP